MHQLLKIAKIPESSTPNEIIEIPNDLVKIQKVKRTEHVREFTPNVIEPSFGIGRIIYSIFEHSFWTRPNDSARGVLSFPPLVAPTKVLIVPLSNNETLQPVVKKVASALKSHQVPFKIDDSSASIGKRYARNDELGTPFGITVDFESVEDSSITLRERDSTKQVRGSVEEVINAVLKMTYQNVKWEDGVKDLKPFETSNEDEE
ncbi:unnamed protein product [[Candida] boidinii]|nr:unnamed protein product [[Candida] boidinii]